MQKITKRSKNKPYSDLEIQPSERTFYPPILKVLGEIGFVGLQEISKDSDYPDILFEKEINRFILEIKIDRTGNRTSIINGIVQAARYGKTYNAKNILVIAYPQDVLADIRDIEQFKDRALKRRVEAVILTDFWYSYETKYTVEELLSELYSKIEKKLTAVIRVDSASIVIQKAVLIISNLLNKYYTEDSNIRDIANHLTKDYGLFTTLSSSKIKESKMRNQTIDLLAYILVNQILFYFLYSKKSKEMELSRRVDEIKNINYLSDLDIYFSQIKKIDYKPIFDIDVVSKIPSNEEIINQINELIECLTPLQISEMKHDLYGRLIGNSLPQETKKILASYYTKTSSADLLANLTVDNYSDTVWDLACGSGTLLVSSYDRKMKLYRNEKGFLNENDQNKLHIKFLEGDITGTDIMPFACHLSGLNLFAKNLKSQTNFVRISNFNSLNITSLEQPITIQEAYGGISSGLSRLHMPQKTWDSYISKIKPEESEPQSFNLEKVDRVVINPPFTRIDKLPKEYRESFTSLSLSKLCGKRIHLWGYFLALNDLVLKDGGKAGSIVPISLLNGKDTDKIRSFYLNNYSIEYIIRPAIGKSFSEDSEFTDIIFIAKKIKPDKNHKVKIVRLKVDIDNYTSTQTEALAKNIKTELEDVIDNPDYFSEQVYQHELLQNSGALSRYVYTSSFETKNVFEKITTELSTNPIFVRIRKNDIHDGQQLRPTGTANHSMFTMHYSDVRIKRSLLSFKDGNPSSQVLKYYNKEKNCKETIRKSQLVKTFRTLTGVNVLDATSIYDYLLKEKANNDKTSHLFIPNKFRLNTDETYLTALYVDEPLCPYNTFTMYFAPKNDAKILALYFNSIFYLIQFLIFGRQSTRGYLQIRQADLCQVFVPDIEKINEETKNKLLKLFEDTKSLRVESVRMQLANKANYRMILDKIIADCLGIKISKEMLAHLYDLTLKEIKAQV